LSIAEMFTIRSECKCMNEPYKSASTERGNLTLLDEALALLQGLSDPIKKNVARATSFNEKSRDSRQFRLDVRGDVFYGPQRAGQVRGVVFDGYGVKLGSFLTNSVLDGHGRIVAIVRGERVFDQNGRFLVTVSDVKRMFEENSSISLIALWLHY
jgi:hypothetical protein